MKLKRKHQDNSSVQMRHRFAKSSILEYSVPNTILIWSNHFVSPYVVLHFQLII